MKSFGYGIFAGVFAVLVGLFTSFGALATFAPQNVPAPAITNLVHLDEKFRFLRAHPEFDPKILAVGSSITWRQLTGDMFREKAGRFLNGGTGFVAIHQTRALLDFYLAHYRNVRTAIVMVGLPDFRDCSTQSAHIFSEDDAARYVFDGWPSGYFYFRYFSPMRYAKTALDLDRRTKPLSGDLYLDAYGAGPIVPPDDADVGLRYARLEHDPACADALMAMADEMDGLGVKLQIVFAPVHPEYRERYPGELAWLRQTKERLADHVSARKDSSGILWLVDDPQFTQIQFFDAFHLRWPATEGLSARVARFVEGRGAPPDSFGLEGLSKWGRRPITGPTVSMQ